MAKIGRNIVAVAVLLATSVKVAVTIIRRVTTAHTGRSAKALNDEPISSERPDSWTQRNNQNMQLNQRGVFKYKVA